MENKVLLENLSVIKTYDNALYDEILRTNQTKSNFQLIQNENGEYNLCLNSKPLHSQIGAKDEAEKIVDKIEELENKNTIRVIWGLGLGYLADEFIQRAYGTIIIFEPNIELLRCVFEILEFKQNLSEKNVFVCSNKQKLMHYLDIFSDRETKITISFLKSYLELYRNEIFSLASQIEKTRGEKQANINTINSIGHLSATNTLRALKYIKETPLVESLKDLYKGKTALIASSGPSLAKNIETVKKYRENFILFAAGPSVKLLYENNITPDFICAVEARNIMGQFEGLDLKESNLILEPYSFCYLWNLETKNKFLFFSKNNFLNDNLAKILKIDISQNKSVGTVSYCALASAKKMGFEKIILCGQDLAFQNGECYAKGSAYEDLECILNPKTNKYEIVVKNYENYKNRLTGSQNIGTQDRDEVVKKYVEKLNKTLYSVVGQNGEILPTQACYAIFIKHFELFAKENPKLELINSSTGGAQINGYKNLELEQALKGDKKVERVEIKIQKPNYDTDELNLEAQKLLNIIKEAKIDIETLKNVQEKLLEELSRRNCQNKNTQKLQEKFLELFNNYTKKYYKHLCLYLLSEPYFNLIRQNINKQDNKNFCAINKDTQKQLENLILYLSASIYGLSNI